MRARILLFVCLALLAPIAARAQVKTGALTLTVQDQTGAVIPGAGLTLRSLDTSSATRSLATDARGVATARDLPQGRYEAIVSFPGFETQTIADLRVKG